METFTNFNIDEEEIDQLLIDVYDRYGSVGFMKIAYIFGKCLDAFDFKIPTKCKDSCEFHHCCECWEDYISTKFNR